MDNNNFKQQQNFDNIESNKANNPGYNSESYHQQAKNYRNEMRNNKQEATKEDFFSKAKANHSDDDWASHEQRYNDAWEDSETNMPDIDG